MRALKFVLDRALELKMPIAINVSYGSNEGSHRGESLFEQYIDQMCGFWKNNIVVAAGNNAAKSGHKRINIKNKCTQSGCTFYVLKYYTNGVPVISDGIGSSIRVSIVGAMSHSFPPSDSLDGLFATCTNGTGLVE